MNPATVNVSTVLANGSTPFYVNYYPSNKAIVVNYSSVPIYGDSITLTTGIKDVAGNPLKNQVILAKGTHF